VAVKIAAFNGALTPRVGPDVGSLQNDEAGNHDERNQSGRVQLR
jgi:hypothetical protein